MSSAASLDTIRTLVVAAPGDDVYARLVLGMLGSVQVKGTGGWTELIFASGSSAVGVHLSQLITNLGMVAWGGAMIFWRRRSWWAFAGLLLAAYGAGAELQLSWSGGSGGEMALAMAATKLAHLDSRVYDSAEQHGALLSMTVNLLTLGGAVVTGWVIAIAARKARHLASSRASLGHTSPMGKAATATFGAMTLLYASFTPAAGFEYAARALQPARLPSSRLAAVASTLPSVTSIGPHPPPTDGWEYSVNGRPQQIRGFGYNPVVNGLTDAQRAMRYDRDFGMIASLGANTIVGWDQPQFDELLMQKAAVHGLGVILPFQLGPDDAYEDAAARQQLSETILQRVQRFRNSPALRMWGVGNEVLHEILRAHGTQVRYDAFAPFLLQMVDRIHEIDPNHPVVYRDAEDWYVAPVAQALETDPKPRPWFVYGMNFFTTRMAQAIDSGPTRAMHQPLLISEYGPVGLRPEDRPNGYSELWRIIADRRDRVLGGLAYVWTTDGPEPLDRNFGLTNAQGQPVDGALAALGELYSTGP